jgi:hypothetical protein
VVKLNEIELKMAILERDLGKGNQDTIMFGQIHQMAWCGYSQAKFSKKIKKDVYKNEMLKDVCGLFYYRLK